jgi:hypothetical protein
LRQAHERRLTQAAEAAGFEILVTTDRNIRHQHNLSKRVIASYTEVEIPFDPDLAGG